MDDQPIFGDNAATPVYEAVQPSLSQDLESVSDINNLWEGIEGYILQLIRGNHDCQFEPSDMVNCLERLIFHQAADFSRDVFRKLGGSLDKIDRSISNSEELRENVKHWQYLLGVWRSVLPTILEELAASRARTEIIATNMWGDSLSSDLSHDILREYDSLLESCRALQERNERTSQAQMATMSILESQNAIEQGKNMQRITELAFVFIPLGFVATVFGMEVKVSSDG